MRTLLAFPLLLLTFLLANLPQLTHAQGSLGSGEGWQSTDISLVGVDIRRLRYDQVAVPQNSFLPQSLAIGEDSWNSTRTAMRFEIYPKHWMVQMDLSFLPNLAIDYLGKKPRSNDRDLELEPTEFGPFTLGFGSWLGENFAVYAGAQYQFNMQYLANAPQNTWATTLGGNQRGFSGHALWANNVFLLRYSFYYDWIRAHKKQLKGTALTHDILLLITPFRTKTFGFFVGYTLRTRKMEAATLTEKHGTGVKYSQGTTLPAISGTDSGLKLGLQLSGIFSTTTRTTTQTIRVIN